MFDLKTLRPFGRLIGDRNVGITSVLFTPDGNTLMTGDVNRRVRFWDVHTQLPRGLAIRHLERFVHMLDIASDGRKLLCGDGTPRGRGGGYVWDLPRELQDDPQRVALWVHTVTGLKSWSAETHSIQRLTHDEWLECHEKLDALGGPPFLHP